MFGYDFELSLIKGLALNFISNFVISSLFYSQLWCKAVLNSLS